MKFLVIDFFNEITSLLSCLLRLCRRSIFAFEPIVKSARGNLEHFAHDAHCPVVFVFFDPGVLCSYMTSLAKYAVAFFRMSFSCSSCKTLFRKRLSSLSLCSCSSACSGLRLVFAIS